MRNNFKWECKLNSLAKIGFPPGAYKDICAGYRNMTAEEKALLQSLISETAGRFVGYARTRRKRKLTSAFDPRLDFRIVSVQTALKAGFIDQIGNRKSAETAEMAGIQIDGISTPFECYIIPHGPALSDIFSNVGFSRAQGVSLGLSSQNVKAHT